MGENKTFVKRGIRQHINFPMDISSYSLEQAKAYIHQIADMGCNFITFHSYPDQWYEFERDGEKHYAGHYFYSEPHPVDESNVLFPYTGNKQYFMIPEHENLMIEGKEQELSARAISWLNAVMEEARECGMEVRLSIELRGGKPEENAALCRDILKQYPCISSLELMTQECGNFGPLSWKKEEIREKLIGIFGQAAESESIEPYFQENLYQLPVTMEELKINLDTIHLLKETDFKVPLSCGIYASDPNTLNLALYFIRELAESDVEMSFMPDHGAMAVAEKLEAMALTPEDMKRCMIYSWAEFDGNMYLQQSEIYGLEKCINVLTEKSGGAPYAIAVNHWRTQENMLTLSYFAEASAGRKDSRSFLLSYAEKNGITDGEKLVQAVDALEKATNYARYHLGNIGFCYYGCWRGEGLGSVGCWTRENIEHGIALYVKALHLFEKITGDEEMTGFMNNRIACSIIHLNVIEHLTFLQPLWGHPDKEGYAQQVRDICKSAEVFAGAYLKRYCEQLPDRGCVGNAVSYQHVTYGVIRHLFNRMTGEEMDLMESDADAPPSPVEFE